MRPASAPAATPAASTGTETLAGQVTGKAAVTGKNGPTIPLTLTGPVATTSSFTPPGGNGTKAPVTFKTPDGNLVVNADAPDANQQPTVNLKTCFFSQTDPCHLRGRSGLRDREVRRGHRQR